jgi:hypothetical protein
LLARIAIFAVGLAALFGGGIALEQSARAPRISETPAPAFQTIGNEKASKADGKKADDKGDKKNDGRPAHCDDGKGRDGEKNKHCQISGQG